jgi:sulfide:quinone oxidoreductase
MNTNASHPEKLREKLRVLVVGGGVAALETALALAELAPGLSAVQVIAPNEEFFYRPLSVREPFAYSLARRYPLERIVRDAGAELLVDELAFIDAAKRAVQTVAGEQVEYDALVIALGAKPHSRYPHAITIDDRNLDETLHGIIQDVEQGYIKNLAFVSPGRMAWPLPLYELALMTAERADEMGVDLQSTIVTPEDSPLAIFGSAASAAVGELLERSHIQTITSAYAEIPQPGEIVISPGDRRVRAERVIALPELYGPAVRGIPLSENGFVRVDVHGRVMDVDGVYAAGDVTDFAVKHGGVGSQQADAVAEMIASQAGAPVTPQPFHPVIHGMLLTGAKPLYLTARITGGHGFSSEFSDVPTWDPPSKIASKYLAPYLDELDREDIQAS